MLKPVVAGGGLFTLVLAVCLMPAWILYRAFVNGKR